MAMSFSGKLFRNSFFIISYCFCSCDVNSNLFFLYESSFSCSNCFIVSGDRFPVCIISSRTSSTCHPCNDFLYLLSSFGFNKIRFSSLQDATTIGECVVTINCTLGNVFFNALIIFHCHFGCRCISTSSIITIPGVSFKISSLKNGFKIAIRYAISSTIPINVRNPELNKRIGNTSSSFRYINSSVRLS